MSWNNSISQRVKSLDEKFWEKADKRSDEECWEWKASKNIKGYGNFYVSVGHSKDKHCLAHRMAYKLTFGEIPVGLLVLHKCDNPACINPKHLFLGTNDDNMKDMVKKGRASRNKGEQSPHHKLTEDEVREIKRLRKEQNMTYYQLAELFNVHYSTIGYIINKRLWSHI